MRITCLLIVVSLFCLPIQAEDEEFSFLPFAYVTGHPTTYDLFVMDARTGQLLQSFATPLNECPLGFSHNRQWFLYFQADPIESLSGEMETFLLDLSTGENYQLDTSFAIMDYLWSESDNLLAYLDLQGKLSIYDTQTKTEIFSSETEHLASTITTMQFHGRDLTAIVFNYQSHRLSIYRWTGGNLEHQEYIDDVFENWDELELSPDGRFLRIQNHSDISIFDLETEEIFFVGSGYTQWLSNEAATLFYLWDNGETISGEIFRVQNHVGENTPVIRGTNEYNMSDNDIYLSYFAPDELGLRSLWLLNRLTAETNLLAQDAFIAEFQWLTETSFIYVAPPPVGRLREVYFRDMFVSPYLSQQLTNDPSTDKALSCLITQG